MSHRHPDLERESAQTNAIAYDRWSSTYDTTLNSTIAVDDIGFPQHWATLQNQRVLEVGCGTGRHTQRLIAQGNQVIGVDLSQKMLDVARKRIESPRLSLVCGNILDLSLDDLAHGEPFDAAIAALVLEHVHDLEGFFTHVAKLLKPGACFYISEIHPLRASAGRLAHFIDVETQKEIWLKSWAHPPEVFENAAKAASFDIIQTIDLLGSSELTVLKPEWSKYIGSPMVQVRVLVKRGSARAS